MWGFGNSAGLQPIGSFKEAKGTFEGTTPIRGRREDVRPLGRNRRYSDHRIVKHMKAVEEVGNPLGKWVESYSARLYRTDCVEWVSDGTIEVGTGGYRSPSTLSFINYTLQNRLGTIQSHGGKWYFHNYSNGMEYYIDAEMPNRLRFEPTGNQVQTNGGMMNAYDVVNPVQEYKRKANRKALNAIRKKYKDFIEYGSNMLSIDEKYQRCEGSYWEHQLTYSNWKGVEVLQRRTKLFKEVDKFIETGDLEMAYSAVNCIASAFGSYNTCTKQQFIKGFNEVLKYQFKEQAFISTPMPIGEAFFDCNAKYFRQ